MRSNRQKREILADKRSKARPKNEHKRIEGIVEAGVRKGVIEPLDRSKIKSKSVLPRIPDYYENKTFTCVDCGSKEVWTAKQQKWWYEQAGGEIETTAIRCRKCRRKERDRRAKARQVHLQGLAKKEESEQT